MDGEEQTTPTTKSGKVKAPKADPAHKAFLNNVVDILLRPTRRRLNFIYPALCQPHNALLVMGTKPDHIVFGNPEEGLLLIKFKNLTLFQQIWDWLLQCGIDMYRVEAVDLGRLASALGTVKGDCAKMLCYRDSTDQELYIEGSDKPVSREIYSLFTMNRFATQVSQFYQALDGSVSVFDYEVPVVKDVPQVDRLVIPPEKFRDTFLGNIYNAPIRFVATRGYDLMCAAHFKEPVQYNGFRVWSAGGNAIHYGGVVVAEDFILLGARCNVFLIPV